VPQQTPAKILYIIVVAEAILATIGVSALSLSLFIKSWADPAILTAMIAITSGLVGNLAAMLNNTRQTPPTNGSTTTTATTTTTTPPKSAPGQPPTPVVIQQPVEIPVPVVETKTENKP
jgi:uncharacterized integral membrane protein